MPETFPELDDDLLSLTDRIPGELEAAEKLTVLDSHRQRRASYRLRFSSGVIVKARRFRTIERAQRAAELAPLLEGLPFNRVIDARGDCRLEEWIDGEVLQPDKTTDELAHWAGDLLGTVHTLTWQEITLACPPADIDWYLDRARYNLDTMARDGLITRSTADRILRLALESQPRDCAVGLIHTDFCGENIVINSCGKPTLVDNEHIMLGALDYDIVRWRYRWPMTASQQGAFLQGYRAHRCPEQAFASFSFWSICSLASSARVRMQHDTDPQPSLRTLLGIAGD
jgi:thiamine kinase-like enzyme